MQDGIGLEMRQEFEEAVEVVESSTTAVTPHFPKDVMEKFHATEADLKNMATRYTGLKIKGMADRVGHAVAHAARMDLRDARILIDKTRKAETAEAQTYIKTCNSVAKYLTNIIAPTEDALGAEEAAYDAEVEAEKGRKQAEAAAALQKRIEALQAVGHPFNLAEITLMTEAQFGFVLASATETFQVKEAARLENEERARLYAEQKAKEAAQAEAQAKAAREAREAQEAAERARIQAEQAAESKRLADARAALKAEQDAFEAKQRQAEQAAREEQIRNDAEAKAKAEAERKAKEDQEAKEAAAVAEKARQEAEIKARAAADAAKPDAEKIRALAESLRGTAFPKLSTDAGRAAMAEIENSMKAFLAFIERKATTLSPFTPSAP